MGEERAVVFPCHGDRLTGILHAGTRGANVGIVIVVGGPQYRVGSHRQFVLMARQIAAAGFPVLRFDYRGMGDSEGETRTFEAVDDDIRAAIDCLMRELPDLGNVVLLGLCDAASANVMYAPSDERVAGLILLNPWVRTPEGEARSYVRHYYLQRVMQRSFWRKAFRGELRVKRSISGFFDSARLARKAGQTTGSGQASEPNSFLSRMLRGLEMWEKPILLLMSGRDLTAQEFLDVIRDDNSWSKAIGKANVSAVSLVEADHTLSASVHLRKSVDNIIGWLSSLERPDLRARPL